MKGASHLVGGKPTTEDRRVDDPEGWAFSVEEVSAGVYLVRGRDSQNRQVALTGTDADSLVRECRKQAMELLAKPPD